MFWLFLAVAFFVWEWFNRSLRTLAVTVAATLAAMASMMDATFSQTLSFFIFETTVNLFLVEMWLSLGYAENHPHEEPAQSSSEGKTAATVKVVSWNPDDSAIVLYKGRQIRAEKESPFIRESELVDIVEQNGHWLIIKAR